MNKSSRFFWLSALILVSVMLFGGIGYAETLYIFYPTTMRSQVMQKKMSAACSGINITVFGRYKDFKTKVKMDSPDAILTKEPVVEQVGGYSIKLKGSRKGSTDEPYVLLAADNQVDLNSIGGAPIGVFDILGRKGMKKYIKKFFDAAPKLKRVSKMEDLLPLLTFNMANAILIPEIYVSYFKEISKLNFVSTPIPKMKTGIIALGVKEGGSAPSSIKALAGMDDKSKALLEVDNWK